MDKLARLFPEAAVEKLSADILDADETPGAVEGATSSTTASVFPAIRCTYIQ